MTSGSGAAFATVLQPSVHMHITVCCARALDRNSARAEFDRSAPAPAIQTYGELKLACCLAFRLPRVHALSTIPQPIVPDGFL